MKLRQPNLWQNKSIASSLLLLFSSLYYAISNLRKYITHPYKPSIPTICIGNITVGGAGKTPIAISIGNFLKKEGYNITYLSKGYKGKLDGPLVVTKEHSAIEVGDEPLLLAKIARTVISKNRKAGIKFIEDSLEADLIIMDDGLQNPTIEKHLSILVVDGTFGLGNRRIFPAGPLRETVRSALKKTDTIVIIGDDKQKSFKNLTKNIVNVEIKPINKKSNNKGKFIGFAGIGNPDKFFKTLEGLKYDLIESVAFEDHHIYTNEDIEKLINKAAKAGAKLITTSKDIVKIDPEIAKNIQVLEIEIDWGSTEILKNILSPVLK